MTASRKTMGPQITPRTGRVIARKVSTQAVQDRVDRVMGERALADWKAGKGDFVSLEDLKAELGDD